MLRARRARSRTPACRCGATACTTRPPARASSATPASRSNSRTAGTKYQGYLGYYGLSLPAAAQEALVNGDTVDKVDYGNGNTPTRTPYTVVKADGKLMKYTRHTRTLHAIDQIKFTTFVGMEASTFFAGAQPNMQYELYWDDAAGDFKVTAQMSCGANGCPTQALPARRRSARRSGRRAAASRAGRSSSAARCSSNLQGVGSPVDSSQVQVAYRSQDLVYPVATAGGAALPAGLPDGGVHGRVFRAGLDRRRRRS